MRAILLGKPEKMREYCFNDKFKHDCNIEGGIVEIGDGDAYKSKLFIEADLTSADLDEYHLHDEVVFWGAKAHFQGIQLYFN